MRGHIIQLRKMVTCCTIYALPVIAIWSNISIVFLSICHLRFFLDFSHHHCSEYSHQCHHLFCNSRMLLKKKQDRYTSKTNNECLPLNACVQATVGDAAFRTPSCRQALIGVCRDLIGILEGAVNSRTYCMAFESIFPHCFPALIRGMTSESGCMYYQSCICIQYFGSRVPNTRMGCMVFALISLLPTFYCRHVFSSDIVGS